MPFEECAAENVYTVSILHGHLLPACTYMASCTRVVRSCVIQALQFRTLTLLLRESGQMPCFVPSALKHTFTKSIAFAAGRARSPEFHAMLFLNPVELGCTLASSPIPFIDNLSLAHFIRLHIFDTL